MEPRRKKAKPPPGSQTPEAMRSWRQQQAKEREREEVETALEIALLRQQLEQAKSPPPEPEVTQPAPKGGRPPIPDADRVLNAWDEYRVGKKKPCINDQFREYLRSKPETEDLAMMDKLKTMIETAQKRRRRPKSADKPRAT